jgi:hypothetical protein
LAPFPLLLTWLLPFTSAPPGIVSLGIFSVSNMAWHKIGQIAINAIPFVYMCLIMSCHLPLPPISCHVRPLHPSSLAHAEPSRLAFPLGLRHVHFCPSDGPSARWFDVAVSRPNTRLRSDRRQDVQPTSTLASFTSGRAQSGNSERLHLPTVLRQTEPCTAQVARGRLAWATDARLEAVAAVSCTRDRRRDTSTPPESVLALTLPVAVVLRSFHLTPQASAR